MIVLASPGQSVGDAVATQTHYVVLATLALAAVTTLAIVVPLIAGAFSNAERRRKVRDELVAIVTILKDRADSITATPAPGYNIGAGVPALSARVFSSDVAEALPKTALQLVYAAVASSTDVILAYVQLVEQSQANPIIASSSEGPVAFMHAQMRIKDHQDYRVRIIEAARRASASLGEALALLK